MSFRSRRPITTTNLGTLHIQLCPSVLPNEVSDDLQPDLKGQSVYQKAARNCLVHADRDGIRCTISSRASERFVFIVEPDELELDG